MSTPTLRDRPAPSQQTIPHETEAHRHLRSVDLPGMRFAAPFVEEEEARTAVQRRRPREKLAVVKIKQYVYFAIRSDRIPPTDVERRVGLAADRAELRGSRSESPPRPASHVWAVHCDDTGLAIDYQVESVVARLTPFKEAIRGVASAPETAAVLQVVRYFNTEDGEEEVNPATSGWPDKANWPASAPRLASAVGSDELPARRRRRYRL